MEFNKKNISIIVGWLVTFLLLGLIAYYLNFDEFLSHLKKVSVLNITILTIIYFTGFFVRAIRTKVMLPMLNFKQALGGIFLGYAANNVLPARLGELVRAQVIGQHSNISRSTTLSNIFVERVLDGVAIVILLFWGSLGIMLPDWANKLKYVGLAIFSIAIFVIILVNILNIKYHLKFPNNFVGKFIANFLEGFRLSMKTPSKFLLVVFLSVFTWTVEAVMFYYGLVVFNIEPASFHLACFVLGTVNLAVLIPSSPGALGLFEFTTQKTLLIFGISESLSLAYGTVIHACQLIPVIIVGLCFMKYFGLKTLKIK